MPTAQIDCPVLGLPHGTAVWLSKHVHREEKLKHVGSSFRWVPPPCPEEANGKLQERGPSPILRLALSTWRP
jgi:hypothetical protein